MTLQQTSFSLLMEQAGLDKKGLATLLGVNPRTVYRWQAGESRPSKTATNVLQGFVTGKLSLKKKTQSDFTFIDLFAGIGGLRLAFEGAGGKCTFSSEWDKFSRVTYAANFPSDHEIAGDIRDIVKDEIDSIPSHNVLVAGFPCQPFSLAGVSKKNSMGRQHGFECETQGTLFFDLAKIIQHHQPPAFLLENVRNLKSHDKGKTFKVIQDTLENELGYDVHYKIIDAKRWVPQHRERIFIAGFRKNVGFSFDTMKMPDIETAPKLDTILDRNSSVPEKYTLTPRLWEYLQEYKKKHQAKGNGFGFSLVGRGDTARTLSARYHKDGSEILIRQKGQRPRRLTPRECARLMGFDRPGQPEFTIPVSDTQAYRQFGNAVVVQAAEAVALHMKSYIHKVMALEEEETGEEMVSCG